MSEELYPYYQAELYFIRKLAQEFATQVPGRGGAAATGSRPVRGSARRAPDRGVRAPCRAASATSSTMSSPN